MPRHPLRGAAAIAGLGITPQGRIFDTNALGFAVDAIALALADAGLDRKDLDGLLVNPGIAWSGDTTMASFAVQQAMGLRDLRLQATMNLGGATAGAMIQHAVQAIAAGLATTVACVFADAPLKPPKADGERSSSGQAFAFARGWEAAYGYFGVNAMYALVARRHMHRYGTTQDQLGAIAVAQRRWANANPQAQMPRAADARRLPRSRWIVEPFHLLDCCLVSNGGCRGHRHLGRARPRPARSRPSTCWGMAQGHLGGDPARHAGRSGAALAREPPSAWPDRAVGDVDVCRAVRLLHLHGARHARGLRLLRQGRGRTVRRRAAQLGPGGRLATQHRRRRSSPATTCGA